MDSKTQKISRLSFPSFFSPSYEGFGIVTVLLQTFGAERRGRKGKLNLPGFILLPGSKQNILYLPGAELFTNPAFPPAIKLSLEAPSLRIHPAGFLQKHNTRATISPPNSQK